MSDDGKPGDDNRTPGDDKANNKKRCHTLITTTTTPRDTGRRMCGPPQRPRSTYDFFYEQERVQWLQENPPGRASQIEMDMVTRWKAVPAEARRGFEDQARRDFLRYEQEMEEYSRLEPCDEEHGTTVHHQETTSGSSEPYSSLSDDGSPSPPSSDGGGEEDSPLPASMIPDTEAMASATGYPTAISSALSLMSQNMLSQDKITELRKLLQQLDQVLNHMSTLHGAVVSPNSSQVATSSGVGKQDSAAAALDLSQLVSFLQQFPNLQTQNSS